MEHFATALMEFQRRLGKQLEEVIAGVGGKRHGLNWDEQANGNN